MIQSEESATFTQAKLTINDFEDDTSANNDGDDLRPRRLTARRLQGLFASGVRATGALSRRLGRPLGREEVAFS